MERTSRLIIVVSAALAVAAHLGSIHVASARDAWLAAAAAGLAAGGGVLAAGWTGRVLLALAFVAPGLLSTASPVSVYFATLWLVPMTAWLVATAPRGDWSIPPPWRPLLLTWGVVVAACWPIVFLRELDFRPSLLSEPMSNGRALAPLWGWTLQVTASALSYLAGVLWLDRLCGTYGETGDRRQFAADVLLPVTAGLVPCFGVALYQSWVDPAFLSYGIWVQLKRASATLLDGNAAGVVAATWSVVLSGWVWSHQVRGRNSAAVASLVLGCLVVLASGSRTALAAYSIGVAFLAYGAYRSGRIRAWTTVTAGTALVVAVVVLSASGWMQTTSPLRRLADRLPAPTVEGARYFTRWLWVRDGWGLAAVAAIKEHPLAGVGIGTFQNQSVDYYFRLTGLALPPDNAQNWWRQQVAEFGIAGGGFAVALTWLLGWLVLGSTARHGDEMVLAAIRGALTGVAVASLFGVPTRVPVVALSVWTFVFLGLQARVGDVTTSKPKSNSRSSGPALLALLLVATIVSVQAYTAVYRLRPPMRAAAAGVGYGHGFWRGGVTDGGEPFWWTEDRAVFVFPLAPGSEPLEFVATPMHPDIAARPVRVRIELGGRELVNRLARDHSPIVVPLTPPPGQRAVFVETGVSRTFAEGTGGEGRGLRIEKRPAVVR